ncbi:MAG: hypothetical protein C0507_20685 [Cyanobacteria bacterium PR.3.49]|jgi:hypothetical protein|nr:hypothetical protein [Cyanobacteria bacterium PR.3.49]
MSQTTTRPEAAPASSETRANEIVTQLNKGNAAGYENAAREATRAQTENPNFWREHGQAINDAVDFRRLGFNNDIQILGVNSRGQVVTTNENGTEQQLRDRRLRAVGSAQRIDENSGEVWGNNGRRFSTNDQGQYVYKFRNGDNLEHIARDVLTHKNGKAPSNSEIAQAARDLAKENNISNVRGIRNDTTIKIPEAMVNQAPSTTTNPGRPGNPGDRRINVAPSPPPVAPDRITDRERANGRTANDSRTAPTGGVWNNMAPPGAAEGVTGWSSMRGGLSQDARENEETRRLPNGNEVTTWERQLSGWNASENSKVTVREEADRAGMLVRKDATMTKPVTFTVETKTGSVKLENVTGYSIVRDGHGQYATVYRMNNGSEYRIESSKDGRVTANFWARHAPAVQPRR